MNKKVDVVILGAGLTGLTLAFYLKKAGKEVLVVEKENRAGGVMKTTYTDDFIYETGPISGSMGSPEMAELFEDLGELCELETANEAAKQRWILKNKQWVALPSGLWSGIATPLFTWSDKFRLLGEPFRKPGNNSDETLADMVKRRMGKSFLDYAVDPFVSGIYAGDPNLLITKYALPKLYNLEQDYGSFIGGAMKKGKSSDIRSKKATKEVFTTKGGIQNLINALTKSIGEDNILLKESNTCISYQSNNAYTVGLSNSDIDCEHVVSTTGAGVIRNLFPFIENKKLETLEKLKYAKVSQAVIGYKKWVGKDLNAFGGLIPSVEKRDTLGMLFSSSLFSKRAPEGGALMTIFMGGIKRPDFINKSNKQLEAIALNEVEETLHCTAKPDLIKIVHFHKAIPQYDISSEERLSTIAELEEKYQGLHLAGNIRDGIGMSDRVKQARMLADLITKP